MKRKKQGNKFKARTTKARGGKSFMPQEGVLNRANMYSDAYVAIWPPHTDCGASATTGPMFKPHADCNPDPSWSITGQNVSAVLEDALKDESGTYDNVRIKDALQLIRDNKGEEAIKRLCRKDDRSLELKAAKEEILGAIKEEGVANRNLTEKALKRTSRRQRAKAASPNKERLMGPRTSYMLKQLTTFKKYLALKKFDGSMKDIYRHANACWNANKKKWDMAMNSAGQKKGYRSSKKLAEAYKNEK